MRFSRKKIIGVLFAGLILQGCTSAELAIDMYKKHQQNAVSESLTNVVAAPRYKVGDPYNIAGVWYYPERDLTYDETGIGSWYGDEFAGRLTANGEIFDPNPDRYFKYAKFSGETAKPSTMVNGIIHWGQGRFIAALLRGDDYLNVWNIKE